jgi:hypothetical protein
MGVLPGSTPYSNNQNFVGNEITSTAVLQGNYYTQYGTGHFEFGNNVKGTIMPAGTSPLTDTSYYITAPPAFWDCSPWPTIGIPNTIDIGSIPAKKRFDANVLLTACENDTVICDDADPCTVDACVNGQCAFTPMNCDDGDSCTTDGCQNGICVNDTIAGCYTSVNTLAAHGISVYPNPANEFIIIKSNITNSPAEVSIMNYTGETIYRGITANEARISFPENMSNGLYLVRVIGGDKTFYHKFIKTE